MKKLISIILLAAAGNVFALSANISGDCTVDFQDFRILANAWQTNNDMADIDSSGKVDYKDLAIMMDEWLQFDSADRAPVIQNISNISMPAGTSRTLSITATSLHSLTYSIQTLPDVNKGSIAGVNTVPHNISGHTFQFTANPNYAGTVTFTFGANDGSGLSPPCGGLVVGMATIQVNATPVKPLVDDSNVNAMAYIMEAIELPAIDDGLPDPPGRLKYKILSLPAHGTLQDLRIGGGAITKTPYDLGWESKVGFITDVNGADSFAWSCNDGGEPNNSNSDIATVNINVAANILDSLAFDGRGYIEFPKNISYDINNGWAVDFWVNIGTPSGGLMQKREPNGCGWEIGVVSNKPKIYMYDPNGRLVIEARSNYGIGNRQWHEIAFIYTNDVNAHSTQLIIKIDGSDETFNFNYIGDFANDANLIIARNSKLPYRDQIDKIRFFSGIIYPESFEGVIQLLSGRTESTGETVLGFGKDSDVLFMCDEAGGITIIDSKKGLIGHFSSSQDVKWHPKKTIYTDMSIIQFNDLQEKRKCNGY